MATMNLRTKGGSTPTPFKKSGQKAAEAIDVVVPLNGCDDAAVAALVSGVTQAENFDIQVKQLRKLIAVLEEDSHKDASSVVGVLLDWLFKLPLQSAFRSALAA